MTWMHTAADNECANTAGLYAVAGSPDVFFLIFLDDDGLDLLVYLVIHSAATTKSSLLLLVLLLLCGNEIPTFEVVCLVVVVDVELRLKMVLHAGKRLYKRTDWCWN